MSLLKPLLAVGIAYSALVAANAYATIDMDFELGLTEDELNEDLHSTRA